MSKRKAKNYKIFRCYSSRLARILRTIKAGRVSNRGNVYEKKLAKNY